MAELKEIIANLDFASDRLSSQVRTLALGVLALVWAFLSGSKDVLPLKLGGSKEPLVFIGGLCILSLTLDLVQYIASYQSSNSLRKRAEANKVNPKYDEKSFWRRIQTACFAGKQITMLFAAIWLLALIVVTVY